MASPNLRKTERPLPGTTAQGTIVNTGNGNQLSVSGNIIPFRCLDPIMVLPGDTVAVEFVAGPTGGSEAWIMARLGNLLRPATGTVVTVPPSSQTITITGDDGATYTATFLASYTPAVNDVVDLRWAVGSPEVLGKTGTVAAPPPPVTSTPPPAVNAPPPPKQTGSTPFAATDSGTWISAYGWDAWAQQNKQVYSGGAAYGGPVNGAWFFNNSPKILAGRTITAIALTLGARLWVGGYKQAADVHVYTHSSPRKPGGNVSYGSGFTVTIRSGAPRSTIWVPSGSISAFGASFLAGGGWGISGEPYVGFNGRTVDPSSGTAKLYWSR